MSAEFSHLGFNAADWCIVAVVVLSSLISLGRGFVKEALSLVILGGAVFFAVLLAPSQAHWFVPHIDLPSLRYLAAFASVFVACLLAGSVLGLLAGVLVKLAGIGALDRLLGLVFGAARGVLLCLGLLLFISWLAPVRQDAWWQQSQLVAPIMQLEADVSQLIAQLLQQSQTMVEDGRQQLEQIQQQRGLSIEKRESPASGGVSNGH